MHIRHTLALTAALSAPFALAQQTAALGDVSVTGASDLLSSFLKAGLSVQPGATLSSVNLRQVEQDVIATGYVKSASASLQTVNGQNVLVIAVVPNATINTVNISGLSFLPADGFKTSLANVLNIAPGATLNNVRIDQSKEALAQNFKAEGYPFLPSISTETKPAANGTVDLNYVIDETAPISRIEVTGSTLLPQATVVAAFKPLYDAKKFTPDAYFAAIQSIQQQYQTAGYLASGINVQGSTLEGGVLKIAVLEGKVAKVDVSALTLPASSAPVLVTRAGGVPSLTTLEQDVRTLSNLSGQSVGFALQQNDAQNPNQVTVAFGVAEANTAPIKSIQVTGNTAVKTADLLAAVRTKVGDVFSRQLAEADFVRLRDVYRAAGYDISTRDAVAFKDGALTFNVHEAKVAGYEITYTGPKRTQERVITRELPAPGTLYNDKTFRSALDTVNGLGILKVTGVTTKAADPAAPENLTYVIAVSETTGTRSFPLDLSYDTISGFAGTIGIQNDNVFGLAHRLSATVTASPNDAGQVFSGKVEYTIPWLDVDFADFRKNRTAVSGNVFSTASGNNPILDMTGKDTLRDFTVRSTGFGLSVGRQLIPNLNVSASVGTSYNIYSLEPQNDAEKQADTDAKAFNSATPAPAPADVKPVAVDDTVALGLVPQTSLTTIVGVGAKYDNTSTPAFPTDGFRANLTAAYGFGSSGASPLGWTKLEGGASTYFGFGRTLEKGFGVKQKQQAFAVRVNAGTYLGTPPAGTTYAVGESAAYPYELRGYAAGAFRGSNYVTSSAEYRYDLGLSNSVAQSVLLIGFADAGTAFSTGDPINVGYSVGLGTQIDLGFNNTPLATVRFDYGFSPATGSGKFHFRLGPVW